MADITINGIIVDPQPAMPASAGVVAPGLAATAPVLSDTSNTNYILVQVLAPLTKAQRTDLQHAGARVIEHVPDNTYVAAFPHDNLGPVRALPFVQWTGPYLPGFKVPVAMSPAGAHRLSLASAAAPAPRVLSDARRRVDVVFHRDADTASATRRVAAAAGLDPEDLKPAGGKVRLQVALNRLSDIAAVDEVRHVEEVFDSKLHNDVARRVLGVASPSGPALPYEGQGQVVCVCDTGFDTGSKTSPHPAFGGRVRQLYALGRPGKPNDPDGHGTHVAGSVLGDGASATLGHRVQGTAPRAELIVQSVLDASGGLGGLPSNLNHLFDPPYVNDDVRIHTNSWGSTLGDGRYDTNAYELDEFVWNHRDFVVCFAAGNEGIDGSGSGMVDPSSVTPPGTAKNCITIGACENDRANIPDSYGAWWPANFPANPITSDPMANNPAGMVGFSGRGPTKDRRFKPDVVAPGTFILSAKSRAASGNAWMASADPLYYFMGGTSMATPLVAGCTALVREFLAARAPLPPGSPSAALVKAIIINGATDIAGQYLPSETGPIPNSSEGFGRVDMRATVGGGAAEMVVIRDEADELDQGEEVVEVVGVHAGQKLKATLVWTDFPGPALQNDLDLIVQANGTERHGNVSPSSSAFDRVNNVEQVEWAGLPAGPVRVIVRAHRITLQPQSFALVVRVA